MVRRLPRVRASITAHRPRRQHRRLPSCQTAPTARLFAGATAATVGVISAVAGSNATCFAQQYTLTELRGLGDQFDPAFARDMNDAGEVVGGAFDLTDVARAVRWAPDGTPTILPDFNEFTESAYGINDLGWVVGIGRISDGDIRQVSRALLWRNGGVENLGVADGATASEAYAVNDAGTVVARTWFFDSGSNTWSYRASTWTKADGWTILPGLSPEGSSRADDINEAGDIIGISFDDEGRIRDTLWRNGEVIDLGGVFDLMWGISDDGVIAGSYYNANNDQEAIIWENGVVTPLGFLGQDQFRNYNSAARGVNADGQVVGWSSAQFGYIVPFLWEDGVMIDLDLVHPDRTTYLQQAIDVNAAGEILVEGSVNGADRGFIMRKINHPIRLSDPVPGIAGVRNTLTATGVTPGRTATFVAGYETGGEFWGGQTVPGCGDLWVNIRRPFIVGTARANNLGLAQFAAPVPAGLAGEQVFLMAVDAQGCEISNLVTWRFPE